MIKNDNDDNNININNNNNYNKHNSDNKIRGSLSRRNFSHYWLLQGLCGTLDRDSRNDLKDQAGQLLCGGNTRRPCPEFIDSWRYVEQEHALNRLQSRVEMKICGIVEYLL